MELEVLCSWTFKFLVLFSALLLNRFPTCGVSTQGFIRALQPVKILIWSDYKCTTFKASHRSSAHPHWLSCCSSALQPVTCVSDVGRFITTAVRLATQWYTTEQPEIACRRSLWQHDVITNKGELYIQRNKRRSPIWRTDKRSGLTHPSSPGFCFHSSIVCPLQGSMSSNKQASLPASQTTEKRPEDPRTLQQRR